MLYFYVLVPIFLKYDVQGRSLYLVSYENMISKKWLVCFTFLILIVSSIFTPKKAFFRVFGLKIFNFQLKKTLACYIPLESKFSAEYKYHIPILKMQLGKFYYALTLEKML